MPNYYNHTVITSEKHKKQPPRGALTQRCSKNLVFTKN